MTLYTSLNDIKSRPCVIALGCFDGVHLGHADVLGTAKKLADSLSLPLAVFTFREPPKNYFLSTPTPLIITPQEKYRILESLGVYTCVSLDLSEEIFSTPAEDFARKILKEKIGAVRAVCGFNYAFGKGSKGNAELLREIFGRHNVTEVEPYVIDGTPVSSSQIRSAVENGDVKRACALLGRPFSITSQVVDGQHLARRLGFPTFNLLPPKGVLLPRRGVYLTSTHIEGIGEVYGITNIGIRPTVDVGIECAETHLFDFDEDLYGKTLTVKLLDFIREERRFESVEQMAEQIRTDILTAKNLVNSIVY